MTDSDCWPRFVLELNCRPKPLLTVMRYRPRPSGPSLSVERTRSTVSGTTAGRRVEASITHAPAGVMGRPSDPGSLVPSPGAAGAEWSHRRSDTTRATTHNRPANKRDGAGLN